MVCSAAGGPQKYSGRSMADSHKPLEDYGQGMGCIRGRLWLTLDKFGVPAQEQAELRAIVNSTRSDIVFAAGNE